MFSLRLRSRLKRLFNLPAPTDPWPRPRPYATQPPKQRRRRRVWRLFADRTRHVRSVSPNRGQNGPGVRKTTQMSKAPGGDTLLSIASPHEGRPDLRLLTPHRPRLDRSGTPVVRLPSSLLPPQPRGTQAEWTKVARGTYRQWKTDLVIARPSLFKFMHDVGWDAILTAQNELDGETSSQMLQATGQSSSSSLDTGAAVRRRRWRINVSPIPRFRVLSRLRFVNEVDG